MAMEKELNLLLPLLGDLDKRMVDGCEIFLGKLSHHDVAVMKCGIGKVNAAINTFVLLKEFNPNLVVNTGVAGGAGNGVRIGNLLVAEYAAYHDVWCGPGTEIGAADGYSTFLPADEKLIGLAAEKLDKNDTVFGLICSGDKFISTTDEVKYIRKNFPSVKAVDMESTTIAQVCMKMGIPFNILRVVSDTPGEGENIEQYRNFWTEAPEKTFHAVTMLLKCL